MGDDDEWCKLLQSGLHFPAICTSWQRVPGSRTYSVASFGSKIPDHVVQRSDERCVIPKSDFPPSLSSKSGVLIDMSR